MPLSPVCNQGSDPTWSWTYASLTEALRDRRILLRVHTSTSSPLPGPGNEPSSSGFTARNVAFRGLDSERYSLAVASLRGDKNWAEGAYVRQVVIDHINNRPTQTREPFSRRQGKGRAREWERRGGARPNADDHSPWISTTGNLDWALWYVARLLSRGHNQVHLAVINNSKRSWFEGELRVAPFLNRPKSEWIHLPKLEKERYLSASWSAGKTREVLFYGRIFGDSLLADMTFTQMVRTYFAAASPTPAADAERVKEIPFALPVCFWSDGQKQGSNGWLSRLRWISDTMPFDMAQENLRRPSHHLQSQWSQQPVNNTLQIHAETQRFPRSPPLRKAMPSSPQEMVNEDVEMRSVYDPDDTVEDIVEPMLTSLEPMKQAAQRVLARCYFTQGSLLRT